MRQDDSCLLDMRLAVRKAAKFVQRVRLASPQCEMTRCKTPLFFRLLIKDRCDG